MSKKIAQTMTTLSEENRDIKLALRLMSKYEVQSLLERLAELGDDSLLLLSNAEGTCSHFATPNAEKFMNSFVSTYNTNLKDIFHKFCGVSQRSASPGLCDSVFPAAQQTTVFNSTSSAPTPSVLTQQVAGDWNSVQIASNPGQNIQEAQTYIGFKMAGSIQQPLQQQQQQQCAPKQPQPLMSGMRYMPYHPIIQGMLKQTEGKSKLPQHVKERKKRNACRHFVQKGYCWQGSTCAFLHTRDPEILANCGATLHTSADSSQTLPGEESNEQTVEADPSVEESENT